MWQQFLIKRKEMPNLLEIKLLGCNVLKKIAEPVESLTDELKSLIEDLIHTMYETDGVGIAAPQVGVSKRIFICDPEYHKTEIKKPIVLINPEFVEYEGEYSAEEGCLSVPNVFEKIKRFEKVTIKFTDPDWKEQTITAENTFAVILQHEYDHLNGIMFVDKLSPIRKMALGFKLNRIVQRAKEMSEELVIL
jgi:peptide deformylase